jgi:hypothetical protein
MIECQKYMKKTPSQIKKEGVLLIFLRSVAILIYETQQTK